MQVGEQVEPLVSVVVQPFAAPFVGAAVMPVQEFAVHAKFSDLTASVFATDVLPHVTLPVQVYPVLVVGVQVAPMARVFPQSPAPLAPASEALAYVSTPEQ